MIEIDFVKLLLDLEITNKKISNMVSDVQLAMFSNLLGKYGVNYIPVHNKQYYFQYLGILLFLLVVLYHFINVNYPNTPVKTNN